MSKYGEMYWEWWKFLLSAKPQEVDERVAQLLEQKRADWLQLTTLFEAAGDQRYKEQDYAEAATNYECLSALVSDGKDELKHNARLKHLLARYHTAVRIWKKEIEAKGEQPDEFTEKVLKRGFWSCWANPTNVEVLVTAINPSFDPKHGEIEPMPCRVDSDQIAQWSHFFPALVDCEGKHWKPIKAMVESRFHYNYYDEMQAAYLDLFPTRLSNQKDMDKLPIELRAALLRITQKELERLTPCLIVHLNKASWFYWGTDTEHPWMGYDLERVAEYQGKGELYLIKGMQSTDKKILPELTETKLKGTYLLLYKSLTPQGMPLKADEMLTEQDIDNIFHEIIVTRKSK